MDGLKIKDCLAIVLCNRKNVNDLKLLQNKKGQKNLGYPRKKQSFSYKRTSFFSGTPNFFDPSYFESALGDEE